jgi:Protein of unknown function (DUF2786)
VTAGHASAGWNADRERAVRRVSALWNKTEDGGQAPEERAALAEQACELMAKWEIDDLSDRRQAVFAAWTAAVRAARQTEFAAWRAAAKAAREA